MDSEDEALERLEEQGFAHEVRDHEWRHKAFLFAIPLVVLVGLAFGLAVATCLMGLCLFGAGFAAMHGGKSRVTGLASDPNDFGSSLTGADLDRMAPGERQHHGRVTGFWLIVLGLVCLALGIAVAVRFGLA